MRRNDLLLGFGFSAVAGSVTVLADAMLWQWPLLLPALGLWVVAGFAWLVVTVGRLVFAAYEWSERRWLPVLLTLPSLPLVLALTVAAVSTDLPTRTLLAVSRPQLERLAAESPQEHRDVGDWVGAFRVSTVERYDGRVHFDISPFSGGLADWFFGTCDLLLADDAALTRLEESDDLGTPDLDHLSGQWYSYCAPESD